MRKTKELNLGENRAVLLRRKREVSRIKEIDPSRKRMKPGAFLGKYGRLIIGGVIILAVVFCAIFAPLLTKWDPRDTSVRDECLLPGESSKLDGVETVHILGTDANGRDMWARLIYGARSTLVVCLGAQTILVVSGTILGLLCGYYTKVEKYLMRFLDAFATIPNMVMCLLMTSVFGPGIPQLMVAMSLHGIPGLARMVRNQVLSLRQKEYIESEKAMGASDLRTVFLHILPACSSYLLVRFSSGLAGAILSMTSLSYLGVGLDTQIPSWGGMVRASEEVFRHVPHTFMIPIVAIGLTVFGFSMLGDGLRDLLDPKLR